LTALLFGHQRLRIVVVDSAWGLVGVSIPTHGTLYAPNFLAVALEDDVLRIGSALGAIPLYFSAIVGALVTSKVALEDLVHQEVSGLHRFVTYHGRIVATSP
jgi:hypothetical protein